MGAKAATNVEYKAKVTMMFFQFDENLERLIDVAKIYFLFEFSSNHLFVVLPYSRMEFLDNEGSIVSAYNPEKSFYN